MVCRLLDSDTVTSEIKIREGKNNKNLGIVLYIPIVIRDLITTYWHVSF